MNFSLDDTIAIIGATGKAGTYLVKKCISQGLKCKVLVRNPLNFNFFHPGITVIKGDALDLKAIDMVIKDTKCVFNTIGTRKNEEPLHCRVTENIVLSMNRYKIKRYISVLGLTVDFPGDRKRLRTWLSSKIMKVVFSKVLADKQKSANLLTESSLDWTLIRIPYLLLEEAKNRVNINLTDCKGGNITGGDLADFLISQIDDVNYYEKAPFISNF